MSFRKVVRARASDQIFEQLKAAIVGGTFPAGSALPAETELATRFGSSRPAVREAIRQLERLGLVGSRQGARRIVAGATDRWSIELLRDLLLPRGEPDLELVRAVLELERDFLGLSLERAAQRRTDEDVRRLRELAELQRRETDREAWFRRNLAFFGLIVEATKNPIYPMVFRTFARPLEALMPSILEVIPDSVFEVEGLTLLAEAIASGNVEFVRPAFLSELERHDTNLLANLKRRRRRQGKSS
jgi:DNA-binding FadR family transcriptional regulator